MNNPPPPPPPPNVAATSRTSRLVDLRVESYDRWRVVSYLALGGLVLGALLAVFGMPPVDLHGPNHQAGIMVPTCGLTRSVAAAVRFDIVRSLRFNPAGILLVLGAAAALARKAVGTVTGRWVDARLGRPRVWWILTSTLVVTLWINQQMHADLLMGP